MLSIARVFCSGEGVGGGVSPGPPACLPWASRVRSRAGPRKEGNVTLWEYRVVVCDYKDMWRPRWVDGRELRDWGKGPLYSDYLKELGREGWELVGTLPMVGATDDGHPDTIAFHLLLKRPLEDVAS